MKHFFPGTLLFILFLSLYFFLIFYRRDTYLIDIRVTLEE